MNVKYLLATTALATLALTGVAQAQGMDGRQAAPSSFEDVDTNSDGYLSRDELNAVREARLRQRMEEERRARDHDDAPAFGDLDSDHDGRISRQEFQQQHRQRWNERRQAVPDERRGRGTRGGNGPG